MSFLLADTKHAFAKIDGTAIPSPAGVRTDVADESLAVGLKAAKQCREALQLPYDADRCTAVLDGTHLVYSHLNEQGGTYCREGKLSARCSRLTNIMADVADECGAFKAACNKAATPRWKLLSPNLMYSREDRKPGQL
jgi:hypothetical protein